MDVANVGLAVNVWALRQVMAMSAMQNVSAVEGQIVNNMSSLDPNLGQNLDISV